MSARLLLVERSAAMRQVLAEHLVARGHEVDDTASYADAITRLDRRFDAFRGDYTGVVVGWPAADDEAIESVLSRLERDDLIDLPVVVMSTDLRAASRAWVASRERTRMVAWKRYRDIDATLDALPGIGAPTAAGQNGEGRTTESRIVESPLPAPASDAHEMRLLVVDDSATIRRSLEDLFTPHGYAVSLAEGQNEAIELARRSTFDIAVVDYYLEDGTGDEVVRELVANPATGDIVCAVLTGTYSDHIIRRSLRAGALECLFKNESSELLLNRVAALSRFVAQRRRLADERRLLDRVFDVVAGPALVLDAQGTVRHISSEAMTLLGHDGRDALVQRPVAEMIGQVSLPATDGEVHRSRFRRADGSRMELLLEHRPLGDDMGSVLQFAPADSMQALEQNTETPVDAPVPASLRIAASADRFITLLDRCLAGDEPVAAQLSLLIVGVWLPEPGVDASADADADAGTRVAMLRDHPDMEARLTPAVTALYRRADHVAALGDGRYAFLLRHVDEPQSWLLTRKLMQMINAALESTGERRLATAGVLKPLEGERVEAKPLLEHCLGVLQRVEARGLDHALLLGPRRMLGVYPQPPS